MRLVKTRRYLRNLRYGFVGRRVRIVIKPIAWFASQCGWFWGRSSAISEGGWKIRSAQCGVWKMRSMENAEYDKFSCNEMDVFRKITSTNWKIFVVVVVVVVVYTSKQASRKAYTVAVNIIKRVFSYPFIMNFLRLYNKAAGTLPMLVFSTAEHQQGVVCNQILQFSNISPKTR